MWRRSSIFVSQSVGSAPPGGVTYLQMLSLTAMSP